MIEYTAFTFSSPKLFVLVCDTDAERVRYFAATDWWRQIGQQRGRREMERHGRVRNLAVLRYKRDVDGPVLGWDEIGRRVMTVGLDTLASLAADGLSGRDLLGMFEHRDDAEAAHEDLLAVAGGQRLVQALGLGPVAV